MLEQFQSTLRTRVLIVFGLVHLGLVLAVFATARASVSTGFDWGTGVLALGILLLYLGFVFGAFFLVWPLLPWFRRAQETRDWGQKLLQDLPRALELIQRTIDTMGPLLKNWMHEDLPKPGTTPPKVPPL